MGQLILQNLTKAFHGVAAVEDLWLEIDAGEIVSLLGPSGCGKSTTLQMIAGVLRPDRGMIQLDGQVLNRVPPEKRGIALVLQKGLLFPHLTVGENVAFGLKMRGSSRAEREERAIAMLQQVQLAGFADRKPAALSGGQAQRVALARALVIQPKLLLLDEPLSALDANLREEMQELILKLQAQTGVTLLIVTHDQSEAVVMSDRIALMFEGRLHQVDTPEVLYHQPCDQATARFFGGVNFFTAKVVQQRLKLATDLELITNSSLLHTPNMDSLQVTIRPEQIQLFADPPSEVNVIPVTVTASRFTGTQRRVSLRTRDGLALHVWLSPTQDFKVGQQIWAYLPPDALWCFPHEEASLAGAASSGYLLSNSES
ncbi:MAG: ABC transporter ATP-binding protein [Elainellaceae cyanobacterium]